MQHFIDRAGVLSNARRTVTGGLLIDATLAKEGVMEYLDSKGNVVRRYNPASLLQSVAEQVVTAPVTNRHPDKFVDASNYSQLSCGHVVGTPRFENGHIVATLAIQDAKLIADIDLGVAREVSMGYYAEHDTTPGVTASGETYDEIRTNLVWNHTAIVPAGRAGSSVRLMLDSENIPDMGEEISVKLKINGKEVEAQDAQSVFDLYDADLQAQLAKAQQDAKEANEKLTAAEAKLAEATSDAAIDAIISERNEKARLQAEKDAKLARVKATFPAISLEGRSQDFIDALDLRIDSTKVVGDGTVVVDAAPAKPANKPLSARERWLQSKQEEYSKFGKENV